jgi:hypothetical protein
MVLTTKQVATYVANQLLAEGVVIQYYEAYSTSSIYLKFDCGLANSLRIGDHRGKQNLNYMFMVDVNHHGSRRILRNKFTQYKYGADKKQLDLLIEHILSHRNNKIMDAFGEEFYQEDMKAAYLRNKNQMGFWKQSKFIGPKASVLHENFKY